MVCVAGSEVGCPRWRRCQGKGDCLIEVIEVKVSRLFFDTLAPKARRSSSRPMGRHATALVWGAIAGLASAQEVATESECVTESVAEYTPIGGAVWEYENAGCCMVSALLDLQRAYSALDACKAFTDSAEDPSCVSAVVPVYAGAFTRFGDCGGFLHHAQKAAAKITRMPKAEHDPAERKKIQASWPFGDFLAKCSLVMERSLGQASSFDVMVDYAGDGGGDEQEGAGSEILKKSMT